MNYKDYLIEPLETSPGDAVMRGVKIFFGVLCFGIGVAFAVGAAHALMHPAGYGGDVYDAAIPAMLGAMFLLGSYLLLRRKPE